MRATQNGLEDFNLLLREALEKAKQKDPDALQALTAIADISPRARLALAELCFAANDRKDAIAHWMKLVTQPAAVARLAYSQRINYLAIFLVDSADSDKKTKEQVIQLARGFLEAYPDSPLRAEVRMKLGETYFRCGNFLDAGTQFEALARECPDFPFTEAALFFAGKSNACIWNASGMENAMLLFEDVAKMGGAFALRARLEQARIEEKRDQLDQALLLLKNILSFHPTTDIRFEAFMMQGNIFFIQGIVSSESYARAIQSWLQIVSDSQATLPWKNQALTKIGAAYQKLGNTDRALASYYEVLSQFDASHPEFFWFYKAGFDAGKLLEAQKLWKESLHVYQQMAAIGGTRSQEAQSRIQYLESIYRP